MSDQELLARYAAEKDQQAFAELVRRHSGWVYSCAKRLTRDGELAEDVTQAVFILLAKKAGGLRGKTDLAGWLFRATGYCAREAMRGKGRRAKHEREAAMRREEQASGREADWEEIWPVLDEAVGRLRRRDREAVLLRFYRGMSLGELAVAVGIGEEAAKKRVQRAVERLRTTLAGKGVSAGVAGLAVVMTEKVAEAAPAGVMDGLSAVAGAGSGSVNATAGAIAEGAAKTRDLARTKSIIFVAVLLLAGGVSVAYCLAGASALGRHWLGWTRAPATNSPAVSPAVQPGAQMTHAITELRVHQVMPNPAGRHEVLMVSAWQGRSLQMIIGAEGQPLKPWTSGRGEANAPDTYSTIVRALKEYGCSIDDLVLGEVDGMTFLGRLRIRNGATIQEIDCRPSDGMNLAVRARCPIRIEQSLVEELYFRHADGTPMSADESWQWLLSLRPSPDDPMTVICPPGRPPVPSLEAPVAAGRSTTSSPAPIESAAVSLDQLDPAGLHDLEQWLGAGLLLPATSLQVWSPPGRLEATVVAQLDPQRNWALSVTEKSSKELPWTVAVLRGAMMGANSPRPMTTTTALRVLGAAKVRIEGVVVRSDDAGRTIGVLILTDGIRRTGQSMEPVEAMSLAFGAHCPVLISQERWDKSLAVR